MIRKQTRIRIYVAALTLFWFGAFSLLLWRQGLSYQRRFDELEATFDERLSERSAKTDSSSTAAAQDDVPVQPDIPRFLVLGHGRCSRWGYLDIQYTSDGAVDRFYYSMDTLQRIPDDIERQCFRHEYGLVPRSAPIPRDLALNADVAP